MEKFKKFYLWSYKTKLNVSIWAMVIVVLNMFFGFLCGEKNMSYGMIIQAVLVASVIGLTFQYLMKNEKSGKLFNAKNLIWLALSMVCLILASIIFSWYAKLWCYFTAHFLMLLGMIAMIIGENWQDNK